VHGWWAAVEQQSWVGGKGRSVKYVKLVDEAAQVRSAYAKMRACRSNW